MEHQNGVEQMGLPKKRANETPLEEVSWSPMNPTSSQNDDKPRMLQPVWPYWADMRMVDCIEFYTEIMEKASALGHEHVNRMRVMLAEQDLFYLLVFIIGRKDIMHPWLYDRCREFQRNPNGHLDLWARDHYKSTIITFGGLIYEVIRNPDITIGIFSHTKPVAKAFLRQIKFEFESKPIFNQLWPDIFWANPQKEAPKWSEDDGIVVKRKTNPKEATIEAHGLVDGMPTGKHFLLRNYDDVVTDASVSTPDQIQKTTRQWELSDNLGTDGGVERYIGTRYHKFDTYQTMMDRGVVQVRKYAATDDGLETGRPVLLSPETLASKRRKQGVYTFACQMLQNPMADAAMGFREAWVRDHHEVVTYEQAMSNLNRIIIVDPSGGKQRSKGNDFTSMWVLGLGGDGHWRVLEGIRDRLNLTQRGQALIQLHRRWKPKKVGYEEYGMQADIEHIQYVQGHENYRFPIIPLGGNQMSKNNRILRLVPYFENGLIHFPPSMIYKDSTGASVDIVATFLQEEFTTFPTLAHDDMLDCLARFIDDDMKIDPPINTQPIVKKFDLEAALHQHHYNNGYSAGAAGSDAFMTA